MTDQTLVKLDDVLTIFNRLNASNAHGVVTCGEAAKFLVAWAHSEWRSGEESYFDKDIPDFEIAAIASGAIYVNEFRTKGNPLPQCKTALYLEHDDSAILIAETPSEAAEIIDKAIEDGRTFAKLSAGNVGEWNGKPIQVRADKVWCITPPIIQR